MINSGFVSDDISHNGQEYESIIPAGREGATSLAYIIKSGGREYFMKRLKPELVGCPRYHELFRKEFEIGSALDHPNIVKYYNFSDNGNDFHILMENIVGDTLDRFIDTHPEYFCSRKNLDKFFNQLLSAFRCLHHSHVVYSDLKPQNIMITQINHDVKIIDLGFCFADSFTDSAGTTQEFSAPEQKEKGRLDVTTDIYCIGKLIEYIGKNIPCNLPGVYSKIMLRCLKKRKKDRLQSVDEILHLINRRSHITRCIVIASIVSAIIFVAFKSISYNEHVIAWWDSFELFSPIVEHDTDYRHIYYRIIDRQDSTLEAVGCGRNPNIYIHTEVEIDGNTFHTVRIADNAFKHKSYIKSVHIPDGIITIGKEAFRECKNLATVDIPNSVTTIDDYAFYACTDIYHIRLSSSITEIPICAFSGTSISSIDIPDGVTIIRLDAFGNCQKLKEVYLPSSLQTLERGVFYNCSSLKSITLPESVRKLGDYLFFDCINLRDIYNHSPEPQDCPPIHRNPEQITLHVPASSVDKYRSAHFWKRMQIVPLPQTSSSSD